MRTKQVRNICLQKKLDTDEEFGEIEDNWCFWKTVQERDTIDGKIVKTNEDGGAQENGHKRKTKLL